MAEPDIEQWRAEVREWLASVLPERIGPRRRPHPDYAVFANITEEAEHATAGPGPRLPPAALRRRLRRDRAAGRARRRRPVASLRRRVHRRGAGASRRHRRPS